MKLLVLDGNSILNRAFYGIRLLTTPDGLYTNAVYGFLNILHKLTEDVKPDATAVAFDLPAPTFRHKAYEAYKAGRKAMPEELAAQMPLLKDVLDAMGIKRLEAEGFEADDILGTEAAACAARGDECVLATGDRDSLQLVGGGVSVRLAATKGGRPETTVYDEEKIQEVYGVSPRQLIDVKALMGDSSDNIPGVPGVGEKTALGLISRFGSLDAVYENLESPDVKPGVRAKLEAGRDSAYMSRDLAVIRHDAPVPIDPAGLTDGKMNKASLYRLLARLGFSSIIARMGLTAADAAAAGENGEGAPAQAVRPETAPDGAALLEDLRRGGCADFCVNTAGTEITAAAFGSDGGVTVALPEKTAGFPGMMRELLADETIEKRTYDIKSLYHMAGGGIRGKIFDTMLAGYLINPLASSYEPAQLCGTLGAPFPPLDGGAAGPEGTGLEGGALSCAQRALAVHAAAGPLLKKLTDNGQRKLYDEVEMPLARVLADMETAGFRVDAEGIAQYGRGLERKLDEIQHEITGMVGYDFNINSTKQLGEALFIKLGLPPKKRTKTGFSTDADVLEALRGYHPVIGRLLEYRQLMKLKSTYTDGLLKVVGPDGRIHSSFNQVETRTGRISSTEPNLQNIPVRSEAGRELRRFFIPAGGCLLIDADYSQIELRILAHIADDAAMIEAFNNGTDIHTLTASQVFKMPPEYVTPLMRSRAKAVNFGIVYGIGAFSLAQDIDVSVKEADSYIKGYLETFSGVRRYMEEIIKKAHEQGYVETLFGRRRDLPELKNSNRNVRAFGERVARNTPIQGTAADIIKIAMVRVCDRLRREGLRSRLILQVHDELIVEAPEEEAVPASLILREEMEGAVQLKVKLAADVHCGKSWYDAKG